MKLDFVEIAGFRGYRDTTRFELSGGFVIIVGRNGAGKSTVFDAVDFALTGSINKYTVTNAKGGGLSEHIWWMGEGEAPQHHVSVGFRDAEGMSHVVTRSRDGGASGLDEALAALTTRTDGVSLAGLMATTLIRDELIAALSFDLPGQQRFAAVQAALGAAEDPGHSQRTEAIHREAKAAASAAAEHVTALRAKTARALGDLTEARSQAARASDVQDALRIVDEKVPNAAGGPRIQAVRTEIVTRRTALAAFDDARRTAAQNVDHGRYMASEKYVSDLEALRAELGQLQSEAAIRQERLVAALKVDAAEREADALATHLAALLDHGSQLGLQDGHCPLCEASRTKSDFDGALEHIRARLDERGRRMIASAEAVAQARSAFAEMEGPIAATVAQYQALAENGPQWAHMRESLQAAYAAAGFGGIGIEDVDGAERSSNEAQQTIVALERARLVLESSDAAERMASIEKQIETLRAETDAATAKAARADRAVDAAHRMEAAAKTIANEISAEQFETIMPLLKEFYRRLRPHLDWTEIDSDLGGKVRGSLNFTVAHGVNPQFTFSSGQRRAAGLAFLFAVHLSRPWCLWNSLLLDDPVQHVDDYRALNLVETLSAIRRTGRQIIVAVEDEALADVLCRRLRAGTDAPGRRFELGIGPDGAGRIASSLDIFAMPRHALKLVS
jgi:chromosome segregation protein